MRRHRYRVGGVTALALVGLLVVGGLVLSREASARASASLSIFMGAVSLERSGSTTFGPGSPGDQLGRGDRVKAGPDAKAAVSFPDGSVTRLDSGTEVLIQDLAGGGLPSRTNLLQESGQTWNRVVALTAGGSFQLHTPNNSTAEVRGTEFSVVVEGRGATSTSRFDDWSGSIGVTAKGGSVILTDGTRTLVVPGARPSAPAPIPPEDVRDPWTVFNRTLDLSLGTPTSVHADSLSPGQSSRLEPGPTADGRSDLDFTLGWPGSTFELVLYDPDRLEAARASSSVPGLTIVVPLARAGRWSYQVRDIASQPSEQWWVIVSVAPPAAPRAGTGDSASTAVPAPSPSTPSPEPTPGGPQPRTQPSGAAPSRAPTATPTTTPASSQPATTSPAPTASPVSSGTSSEPATGGSPSPATSTESTSTPPPSSPPTPVSTPAPTPPPPPFSTPAPTPLPALPPPPTPLSPVAILSAELPDGELDEPYYAVLSASGGKPGYRWAWTATARLPPGLTLSHDGLIRGTPTLPADFHVLVTVTDATGSTATRAMEFKVRPD